MWLVEDSIKGLFILSGTTRERRSVGRILWLIRPGWLSSPRNYSRTKQQCYLGQHRTYLRTSERRSAACSRTRRGRSAGLGYESGGQRAPSALPPYGHSGTAGCTITRKQPPTEQNPNATNTASTATSCSGQGTPVQPRRGRLDFSG
uniref:Uncharacterized protein n=1 Tax=Hyaloperonospora arabidopsidis (strain Emoy2) TaxID=559515 RepID=M4BPJ5_HYAAE